MRHHRFHVKSAIALLLAAAAGCPALAADAGPASIVACTISAWSADKDPKGLNVRAGPGTGAPVIARLPPPLEVDGDEFAAEVSITGSKDGWFRIASATLDSYIGEQEPEVVFEGEGWVSGRFLGLLLNDARLHKEASETSPLVARLASEDADGLAVGPDSFLVDRLHACQGNWVEVEGTFLGARLRGWTTRTCSNQVTTCP